MSFLLDSNVVMAYLNRDQTPGLQHQIEQAIMEQAAVSVITTIEVLGWRGHTLASRNSAEQLLSCFEEIPLAKDVVLQTIQLRSQCAIKLPDAVIAACALSRGLILMTRNVVDFERISALKITNPFVTAL